MAVARRQPRGLQAAAAYVPASPAARENTSCALLRVAQLDGTTTAVIGCAGAILLLVSLLEAGGVHGKKGAAKALYGGARVNQQHTVEAGVTAGSRTRGEAVSRGGGGPRGGRRRLGDARWRGAAEGRR